MRYRVVFSNGRVGQAQMPPFETDVPDGYGVAQRTAELSRLIRGRVVSVLTFAPAPGAEQARDVIEQNTQVTVMLTAGQGAAYYGVSPLGAFNLYEID